MGRRRLLAAMGAFVFLGMLLGGRAAHPAQPAQGRFHIAGVVAEDILLRQDGSAQGYLENTVAHTEAGPQALGTVYWTFVPGEEITVLPGDGDRVAFEGTVYLPSGPENPYGFDFRMFLLEKGISCGVSGAKGLTVTGWQSRGLPTILYQARHFLSQRLTQIFGEESALPQALLLGERHRLPEDVQNSFADAGVAHILSVSGLHVSVLAYCVLRLLPRRLGPKKQLLIIFLFLMFYCGLLGYPAPAMRATLFVLLNRYRRISWRGKDWVSEVAAAFLIILLFSPLSLFSASFQLSFCAVIGIFSLLPRLQKALPRLQKSRLGQHVLVTLAATGGLMIPSIQFFHSFSVVGLLVNPLVCMVFIGLLPMYAALMFLGCVWLPGAQTLAVPIHILTSAITDFLTWAGQLPFAKFQVPHLPWYVVAALILAFLTAIGLVRFRKITGKYVALAAAGVSLLCWGLSACRDVQYIQLSMGQADCAIICDGRETVVVDTGEYGGDAASYLLCTGRRADTLVITHLHKDHCLGLAQLLKNDVPIGRVVLPVGALEGAVDEECLSLIQALREKNVPIHFMHAGQYFETARCRITALWPMENTVLPGQDANRYSLCLLMDLDGVRLLSLSDVEGAYEMFSAHDADIIKVAHHGSKSSTGDAFLQAVTPKAALITGTGRNEYLPARETLARLEIMGVSVYNTGDWGAVTLTCRDGTAAITPYFPINQTHPGDAHESR